MTRLLRKTMSRYGWTSSSHLLTEPGLGCAPWHGEGDLSCTSSPSSGHSDPMGFTSCGGIGFSLVETSKAATIALVLKRALQEGGMTGAEHELGQHSTFSGYFPASSPPPPPILWFLA